MPKLVLNKSVKKENIIRPGFTLIQMIIAVAIVGVIGVLVLISMQDTRAKSRDTKRVKDAQNITLALQLYKNNTGEYPQTLTPGQPLEFNNTIYMEKVPTNPTPRADGDCLDKDYSYASDGNNYVLSFCLSADQENFSAGVNLCDNGECGAGEAMPLLDHEGNSYSTVAIGGQLWMADNLKTRYKPNGTLLTNMQTNSERDCIQSNNTRGTESHCNQGYTLYTWAGAMDGSTTSGARGICPLGWHIPTDNEFHILEKYLSNNNPDCNPDRLNDWKCSPAGSRLKSGGDSGFNSLLPGFRGGGSWFSHFGNYAYFWTSNDHFGTARLVRGLINSSPTVYRDLIEAGSSGYSMSVRCLKD